MVTLFQSITLEGWVDVMYQLQDGTSGMQACAAQQQTSKQAHSSTWQHSSRQPCAASHLTTL